ncbi:ATP-binding protein [Kineococcus arenarius]|uniref:ATP-binding protein n=1 Tax=Kineococcus sp. SYSU DK007 TaxID=3383128 RepID=UPI003D7F011B
MLHRADGWTARSARAEGHRRPEPFERARAPFPGEPERREARSVPSPDWSCETTLAPEPASSRAARHVVADWCIQQGLVGDVVDTLLLLTAEVVTNAVIHGRSDVVLRVGRHGSRVRVGVGDENTRLPLRREPDPDALDGRGMALLEALADSHGVEVHPFGKVVWFDVVTHLAPVRTARAC